VPNKRPDPPEPEISWRTEELGPETRRRLFEKLVPSARPASGRDRSGKDGDGKPSDPLKGPASGNKPGP
jgi:hypothetical protein